MSAHRVFPVYVVYAAGKPAPRSEMEDPTEPGRSVEVEEDRILRLRFPLGWGCSERPRSEPLAY
jgi:hypothetical protein